MIKVYQVSRRYVHLLFMHNNKYLPVTGLLTLFVTSGCDEVIMSTCVVVFVCAFLSVWHTVM